MFAPKGPAVTAKTVCSRCVFFFCFKLSCVCNYIMYLLFYRRLVARITSTIELYKSTKT